jgi:hypothetical protein
MHYTKLYGPPSQIGFLEDLKENDSKTYGAVIYLFSDLAESISTNEDNYKAVFAALPGAVEAGLFRIDWIWTNDNVLFRIMVWSPTEGMYKVPPDMNRLEDTMAQGMVDYYMSVN